MFELLSTVLIVMVICWTIAFFFATMFLCRTDFWAIWGSLADLLSHCADTSVVPVYFSATDVFTDILILILPLRSVCHPRTHSRDHLTFVFLDLAIADERTAEDSCFPCIPRWSNVRIGTASDRGHG